MTHAIRPAAGPSRQAASGGRTPHAPVKRGVRRRERSRTSLLAHGEPMVWLTGGALAVALLMITGLLLLVLVQGAGTFWPRPVERFTLHSGAVHMGEVTRVESFEPDESLFSQLEGPARARAEAMLAEGGGLIERRLVRIGNYELTGEHFAWVSDYEVAQREEPAWALIIERLEWGRFYGEPKAFLIDGEVAADSPEAVWALFNEHHRPSRQRWRERRHLEVHEIGRVNARQEAARIALRQAEIDHGVESPQAAAAAARFEVVQHEVEGEFSRIRDAIRALNEENARFKIVLSTAQGQEKHLEAAEIVRAFPANQLDVTSKAGVYASRWKEFLTADPREANSEGGVFPAIFGTVLMTIIMSLLVVPFGVLAALYLREYAKGGVVVSAVRIAVNNLAGVPSIVFGVFGLGFFCYLMGGTIDQVFFQAKSASGPTFGTGGLFWASLTLALLTLPVVIVATEEALAAVPNSMREGSYACGASKWQTIKRIVLPRAMPGIMTGMILAMARGAGEVAPLMLVGAVKLAPELPGEINSIAPFFHIERSFMHLGFHIYDLGFQSQNSEAAKPMVFTTTLLLIAIIAILNLAAIWLRMRLRRKFVANQF